MKTRLSLYMVVLALMAFDGNDFTAAIKASLSKMHQAKTVEDLHSVANTFERIGATEKKEWLPYYYAAYSYVMMTTFDADVTQWDKYLDAADALLAKAEMVKKNNKAEILALKGFSAMMRINVDPAVRGQEYSMKSGNYLQQAYQLDAKNPRVIMLMGHMLYGTAQFFGSSTDEACSKFAEAKTLFEQEETNTEGINPRWGKPEAIRMLNRCRGNSDN